SVSWISRRPSGMAEARFRGGVRAGSAGSGCRSGVAALTVGSRLGGEMTDEERKLGARWFEEVWNQGRREAITALMAPECVVHDGPQDAAGPEGFLRYFDMLSKSLSDIHVTVLDSIGEGDRLCVRWQCDAIHAGELLKIPATGRKIHVTGITIFR